MTSWQINGNRLDFADICHIEASKDVVYQVLADMEAYPKFLNDLVSVKRDGNQYRFVARAAVLTIPATLAVSKSPGRAITFELVEGPVEKLNGSWLIQDGKTRGQTQVVLNIQAETGERGEWLLRMTAKFLENKSDKLIAAFTARVIEVQNNGGTAESGVIEAEPAGFVAWLKRLWARSFGRFQPTSPGASSVPSTSAGAGEQTGERAPAGLFDDEHRLQTLEALAATMLPTDNFDAGVENLGFTSVAEMRARYEPGRYELYAAALEAVDKMAQSRFGRSSFVDLTTVEQTSLLDAIRQDLDPGRDWGQIKPSAFFSALWEDTMFLYCTHPDTWARVGFPGPSFFSGGYQDFDQPQIFTGREI
jgi:ribosome-associated toxin RatA of RatAB toxin-antitoxin module